ncbi:hypothetical protein ADL00_03735 [Streptomyces sp. AS58]|uniref:hypothetical protein n=1 Tax=Streptomyces TaxID=1883 RepID=UPI0006AD9ABE|nr:hypothetical protein [Streptomyces sp. AS58]KOV73711.1 hypothetical protein ADL00_03735 [Streptomyces sp. AS58]
MLITVGVTGLTGDAGAFVGDEGAEAGVREGAGAERVGLASGGSVPGRDSRADTEAVTGSVAPTGRAPVSASASFGPQAVSSAVRATAAAAAVALAARPRTCSIAGRPPLSSVPE